MSKEVFTIEKLDPYRNDPRIIEALNGRVLLNYEEYIIWNELPEIKTTFREVKVDDAKKRTDAHEERVMNARLIAMDYLYELSESVCESKIGKSYGRSAIENLHNYNFDLLVILEKNYLEVKEKATKTRTKVGAYNKLRCILGFIIIEQGECRERSNSYTVNLICTRTFLPPPMNKKLSVNSKPFIKAKAAILLGAYMCCIRDIQYYGLLELASGYKNLNGFFSYSKLGFVKDSMLLNENCFNSFINLPMSVRIGDYTDDQIIGFASGKQKLKNIKDDTGLIKLIPEEGNAKQKTAQATIALFTNILFQLPYYLEGHLKYEPQYDKEELLVLKTIESEYKENQNVSKEIFFTNRLNNFITIHKFIFDMAAKNPNRIPSPKEEDAAGEEANPDSVSAQVTKSIKKRTTIMETMSRFFRGQRNQEQTNPLALRLRSSTEKNRIRPASRSRTAKMFGNISKQMSRWLLNR